MGSGGGYFTYRFTNVVSQHGRVYAVDTNEEFVGQENGTSKTTYLS
ncbi:MAG: hypothetical protein MUC80_04095 [Candidatus Thermoplasmatota archaeon]|nr:hypothetical protein [Candidatus Thermoplasmatota archaeon]